MEPAIGTKVFVFVMKMSYFLVLSAEHFTILANVGVNVSTTSLDTRKTLSINECARECKHRQECCVASFKNDDKVCLIPRSGSCMVQRIDSPGTSLIMKQLRRDCDEIASGCPHCKTGKYWILPDFSPKTRVFCDMNEGRGWTIISNRMDGSVNFSRGWQDYKQGFGHISGEFWLGNDNIHRISTQKRYILTVHVEDWNSTKRSAEYDQFWVGDEKEAYKLHVHFLGGSAGDSLTYHDGLKFSTFDRDNDLYTSGNCAENQDSGWWFGECYHGNLNGVYEYADVPKARGIGWETFRGVLYSLKAASMSLLPKD